MKLQAIQEDIFLRAGELISPEQVKLIYGSPIYDNEFKDLNDCLRCFQINTPVRMRHFLSQTAHISGGLRWMQEQSNGLAYDGNSDLGNIYLGDGPRYKGAGVLQLTGRINYQAFSNYIDDLMVMNGFKYVSRIYPFSSAGFWWYQAHMNELCDRGASVEQITLRVNGACNGFAEPREYYIKACAVIPD